MAISAIKVYILLAIQIVMSSSTKSRIKFLGEGKDMTRIQDKRDWAPKRTVGELWYEVLTNFGNSETINEELIRAIFAGPKVAGLLEEWLPKRGISEVLWNNCAMLLEAVDCFWKGEDDWLVKVLRKDKPRFTKLRKIYEGNVRYFIYDYHNLRKQYGHSHPPITEYNEEGWPQVPDYWPRAGFLSALCGILEDSFYPETFTNEESQFFNSIVPEEIYYGSPDDEDQCVIFWLFDSYLPVHYLEVLSTITKKAYPIDKSELTLSKYELDLLNYCYSRRLPALRLSKSISPAADRPFYLDRDISFGLLRILSWNEILQFVVFAAAYDFVDDLINVQSHLSAIKYSRCVSCSNLYEYTIHSRNRKYCSETCSDREAKRRQRIRRRQAPIERRKLR